MPVDLRYFSAFCAMKRGSREYCSLVMGSTMLQMSDSVGSFMKGSITAVSGSGTTSMSLAWMGIQPRMDEPSNPRPSSKMDSVSSETGTLKCCQSPMKSMNFRSTMTACLSFASPMTSLPFGILCCPLLWEIRLEFTEPARPARRCGSALLRPPWRRRSCRLRCAPSWQPVRSLPEPLAPSRPKARSEEHTSELQSQFHLVCRLLLEKKKNNKMEALFVILIEYIHN